MIPRICANCAKQDPVVDGERVYGCVCKALPVRLWKEPGDTCMLFDMSRAPLVYYPGEGSGQNPALESATEPKEGE